nr:ERAD-associated E3 ubiquitin-protein ligase [Cryptomonas curvata]
MISVFDIFSNLINTSAILYFITNLFTIKKKNLDTLSFLEYISKKNAMNVLVSLYVLLFGILTLKSITNNSIIKAGLKLIKYEAYEFFSFFIVDKKIIIQGLRSVMSELLLAILFCKRKFSAFSTFTFVLFMVFKTFYIPCIDKLKNIRSNCDDFSKKWQIILIVFLFGLLYFQVFLYKIILQFYRKRIVNVIMGSEIVYLTSIIRIVIIGHLFAFFNIHYFNNKWFLEESCEFYQKMSLSFMGMLSYVIMLKNISVSKKAIFRYYALRRIFGCVKELILDLEEFIRFRKTLISIDKQMKTPTDNDVNNLSDKTCIICRDDVKPEFSKMLSCCHIFHIKCLQNWLRRQYCCPTCMSPISSNNLNSFNNKMFNLESKGINLVSSSVGFFNNATTESTTDFSLKGLVSIPSIKPEILDVLFIPFHNNNKNCAS